MKCNHCGVSTRFDECNLCYRIRNGMDTESFYRICKRIDSVFPVLKRRKISQKRVVAHPLCEGNCVATQNTYGEFVRQSRRLRLPRTQKEPHISEKCFQRILKKPCVFCGVYPSNGIDRIESNTGYTQMNVQPSCSQCNYMKKNINNDSFINKIELITDYQEL